MSIASSLASGFGIIAKFAEWLEGGGAPLRLFVQRGGQKEILSTCLRGVEKPD